MDWVKTFTGRSMWIFKNELINRKVKKLRLTNKQTSYSNNNNGNNNSDDDDDDNDVNDNNDYNNNDN